MPRQLHLNVNILNAGVFGGSWRFPGTDPLSSYRIEHYTDIAKKAERARLDAVFLADGPSLDPSVKHRTGNNFEPTTVLARIAAQTERIGLIGTLSSSYHDAGELARRLGDLDHVSGGRVGWNVVTTAGAVAARNFGRDREPEHSSRYQRAAAFTEQVVRAWSERTRYSSPQGRPVVVQAGGSRDGRELASRVAEVVFSADQDLDRARAFRAEIRAGAARHGRDPGAVVVLPGLSTVVGSTVAEANARRELLDELLPDAYGRGRLAGQLGISLDGLSDDEPIPRDLLVPPDEAGGSQTFYRVVKDIIDRENPTLGALLKRLSGGGGHRIVTGTPEQIADDIETWFRAGAADGFNVMPDVLPSGFDDFAGQVVPELRRRGLFRTDYEDTTLRGHLGLPVPRIVPVPEEVTAR
ncbi:LLM class flavin-dependent oxidoreductase [Amycolatopsis jiangsuensis]|uniref:Alkanesulfonate monooxygenase SsuD/methylene tetrahydromethanopterin reductase-like flavin-dependent oxidoreductase (Luciferase family) n=1 Tax=Amycolatopsis jiangsuensis TaxID=1181879 RepID=A0A840ISF7_9PSEU|nr:LLM class flavin-dependent oxidoreductase [Amycolatopsis jiangsuensis]MBB4683934.1 alkanesulfonate monooxygenase SsuD/methylene tetrahydromethanopterin reductase-like flavin-dependent oxidoreductase (luciferase family) [Amycolatopsis jiangsuensis]